jgi:hypothetical protein
MPSIRILAFDGGATGCHQGHSGKLLYLTEDPQLQRQLGIFAVGRQKIIVTRILGYKMLKYKEITMIKENDCFGRLSKCPK